MKRSQVLRKTHRYKRKKSIFRNRIFWLGILTLIIFLGIFYLICFSSFFQIKEIKISGNQKVSSENLQNIFSTKMEKKILFFRTKSIFLVNSNEIKKDILDNFPQIAAVEVKRGFPDSLSIVATERLGLAIWRRDEPALPAEGGPAEQCFLLDKEGIIFEEIQPRDDFIRIIDKKNTDSFTLGDKVIEKDSLDKILKIQKRLRDETKINAKDFVIFSDRLTIKTPESWEVYFDLTKDIDWQLTKLNAVLDEKIPPEKRGNLEYIELRFGNFAPFKYKD